ncbi:MAG: glycosyltransferase family 4 protein, partial [Vicinamibacterales bacterium]
LELLDIEPATAVTRILVKPNGINVTQFPAVSRNEPRDGECFSLVSVSRIEPKKGLLYLVDAVARLRDRNARVQLHVIGGVDDSPASRRYHQEVATKIQALGLDCILHLEGRRSEAEINEFFKASHVFVAPFVETESGDKDGVPTALLEAMASGLPVVATDAGSILEVIEHDLDGVIVPQRDPDALADAIAVLLADVERRSALGKNGARKVRQKFDATTGEGMFHERLQTLLANVQHDM